MIDWTQMQTAADRHAADLDAARQAARAELALALAQLADAITGVVPEAEKLSWSAKEAAARALVDQPTIVADPVLQAEAALTGEAVLDLARKVIVNANAYRAAAAVLAGVRRVAERAIREGETVEDILAIPALALAEGRSRLGVAQ